VIDDERLCASEVPVLALFHVVDVDAGVQELAFRFVAFEAEQCCLILQVMLVLTSREVGNGRLMDCKLKCGFVVNAMTVAGAISCDGERPVAEIELPNVKLTTVLALVAAMLSTSC
jgi:hypothetical protein